MALIQDIFKHDNKYSVVYTDPPWPHKKGNVRKTRPNQGRVLDYPTLSLDEIGNLHHIFLRDHTEQKHNVFVWAIDKFLPETESMFEQMGYSLHARMIWDKKNGIAPAFTVRFSHEYLLWFYRKGEMLMPDELTRGKYMTVMHEQATKHSKKPMCAYEMLDDMFPQAKKIELFARNYRDGWDSWGNELPVLGSVEVEE